jgi:8-oxo-dGTP diphosphatase
MANRSARPGKTRSVSTHPEVCVGAIVIDDERLLLIRRGRGAAQGEWSIPGGRVERGEMMIEAVVRELEEETGLIGVVTELVGVVERISDEHHFVIVDYFVEIDDPDPIRAGDDAAEAIWVPLTEVAEHPNIVDGLVEFLHDHGILDVIV